MSIKRTELYESLKIKLENETATADIAGALWNDFHDYLQLHKMPVHAQLLWYKLFDLFWRNDFELDVLIKDFRLLDELGTKCRETLYNSRNRLMTEGFLSFTPAPAAGALASYTLTFRNSLTIKA